MTRAGHAPAYGIERWLPQFDIGHRFEVNLPLAPAASLPLALASPAAPDLFVRALFILRGMTLSQTIEGFMAANHFTVLERSASTIVVGRVEPLSAGGAPEAWVGPRPPGSIWIAADLRAEPVPGGSRLVTETRVAAADPTALRKFRLYWAFVGPFSKWIRRRWLESIELSARAAHAVRE